MIKSQETAAGKKDEIVRKAISLFEEYGYDNVSLNRICEESGVSKTTFYYYFKSKEDLITEYLPAQDQIMMEHMADVLSRETSLDQYWGLLSINIDMNSRIGEDMLSTSYITYLKRREYYLPHEGATFAISTNLLVRCQRDKLVLNITPAAELNEAVCYALRGVCMSWAMNKTKFDLITECKKVVKSILILPPGVDF